MYGLSRCGCGSLSLSLIERGIQVADHLPSDRNLHEGSQERCFVGGCMLGGCRVTLAGCGLAGLVL